MRLFLNFTCFDIKGRLNFHSHSILFWHPRLPSNNVHYSSLFLSFTWPRVTYSYCYNAFHLIVWPYHGVVGDAIWSTTCSDMMLYGTGDYPSLGISIRRKTPSLGLCHYFPSFYGVATSLTWQILDAVAEFSNYRQGRKNERYRSTGWSSSVSHFVISSLAWQPLYICRGPLALTPGPRLSCSPLFSIGWGTNWPREIWDPPPGPNRDRRALLANFIWQAALIPKASDTTIRADDACRAATPFIPFLAEYAVYDGTIGVLFG